MTKILTEPVQGPSVWRGEDVADPARWTYELDEPMRAELLRAAEHLREHDAVGVPDPDVLPMPRTAELIDRCLHQLEHGEGLSLVKGVPVDGLPLDEAKSVYWAVSQLLGNSVPQNGKGDRIVSIRNYGVGKLSGRTTRGYQTKEGLPFHSDAPDIAALLCLRQAATGGEFFVASAMTIYNELLARHRELIGLYYAGYYYDYRGEEPEGELPAYRNAIFGYHDGQLTCRYFLRQFAESGPRTMGLELSDVERAALDAFEAVAENPENHVTMRLEPGDLQLVDDNVTVHRRASYDDPGAADGEGRHLLRLWTNVRGGRQFPTFMSTHRHGMQQAANVAAATGAGPA